MASAGLYERTSGTATRPARRRRSRDTRAGRRGTCSRAGVGSATSGRTTAAVRREVVAEARCVGSVVPGRHDAGRHLKHERVRGAPDERQVGRGAARITWTPAYERRGCLNSPLCTRHHARRTIGDDLPLEQGGQLRRVVPEASTSCVVGS